MCNFFFLIRLICWLHTGPCKYNLSVLGTLVECEGVEWTHFNFTLTLLGHHGNVRSSNKLKFTSKYVLRHTW